MVTAIKEHQIDVVRQSIKLWYGGDVAEDIWKYRFTYRPMENMEKPGGAYQLLSSSIGPHMKFGIWRRMS